ncbi:hypothetical protein Dfri01_68210 [Dyadobacter frigoris]|nr:hypothetical protein Dfri01_68210 [Dyadobacter frigoris]
MNEKSGPYYPDSIKVMANGNPDLYFKRIQEQENNNIKFQLLPPFSNEEETLLLLYLNNIDSDTLLINYSYRRQKCESYYQYTRLRYNGRDIAKTVPSNVLELVKK